ncbi:flagellin modification protein A [Sulfuricaulis limicola]|uniref:Flagellin modification protein A n=1 Tax=Sulfuricaulis limicola TaxID=1620215 RepID=A0A1B4XFD9_9GAMM|nr:oxidoreductase [Sulfuricaulis limicola]BAV33525.1 flagellin modification protein A [Sulfuricaulis limicola]
MLNGKVVVITGGAGLLGRVFSAAVADAGGVAVVADVNLTAAERVAQEINNARPGGAAPAQLDISDPESVNSLIELLHGRHGRIDAVVNNAYPRNKNWGRKLEDVAYGDFCENMDMHLGGYFLVMQRFSLYFKSQGFGNIVNLASIYGTMVPRFEIYAGTRMTVAVEYAAIKSAIIQLTRYFAQYFKHDGVRFNCISPGGILDNQPESFLKHYNGHCGTKGMLDSKDISGTLIYLLSDASRYVTGQNIIIDDGFAL